MPDLSFLFQRLFNLLVYRPWLRRRLARVGANFRLGRSSTLLNPACFSIGHHFFSGPFSYFGTNSNNPVVIGDYVMFGPGCTIQGGNHDIGYQGFMYLNDSIHHEKGVIRIGNGAWIGSRCTIISGADIGEGSVIAAMSLVNKPVPPFVVVGGVPVRVIKPRFSSVNEVVNALRNTESKLKLHDVLEIHASLGFFYDSQGSGASGGHNG